jgi:hypothetical protein
VRDAEAAIRRLAVRWRLVGGDRGEFQELVARVAEEVFQPSPRAGPGGVGCLIRGFT